MVTHLWFIHNGFPMDSASAGSSFFFEDSILTNEIISNIPSNYFFSFKRIFFWKETFNIFETNIIISLKPVHVLWY
jgi:hypothetical protein